jgi:hypothetical protein
LVSGGLTGGQIQTMKEEKQTKTVLPTGQQDGRKGTDDRAPTRSSPYRFELYEYLTLGLVLGLVLSMFVYPFFGSPTAQLLPGRTSSTLLPQQNPQPPFSPQLSQDQPILESLDQPPEPVKMSTSERT